jgi:hypothetical protein
MSSITVSLIAVAFIFGGALLGMLLRAALPEHHPSLSTESKDVVKLGMGLVGTMAALVLGLLVASAKSSYDAQSTELTEMSAKIILLDRVLAHYGPETKEIRDLLRSGVVRTIDQLWPQEGSQKLRLDPTTGSEVVYDKIQALSPKDDRQRLLQSQALSLMTDLGQTRWLMFEQGATSVSKPLVIMMVFWLTIVFISWGIFAPRTPPIVATLFVAALSVSGAIFLILEMYTPYAGLIRISSAPLRATLAHLGQ